MNLNLLKKHAGLYTDHYELAMAQAYFLQGKKDTPACFEYFYRKAPFKGSYVVFAGLHEMLRTVADLRFEQEDLRYLQSLGFKKEFVDYLEKFSFKGNILSAREGEIVFPNEPILRVEANLLEGQLLETLILNILNYESLIATKAARIRYVAGDKTLIEFGLRRAQGLGGIQATKAAVTGGFDSTSNVYGAYLFDLSSSGTLAHSFIQSYDNQLEAFRAFASVYPQQCTLLVDTYDTIRLGVPDAITVGKELEQRGEKLYAIRIDSGDLAYLSKRARRILDEAGLPYVKIVASNQMDEYIIRSLIEQKAPIDAFGVGTSLVTGKEDGALDGIYKLTMSDGKPRLKISEDVQKILLPGVKKVLRYLDTEGKFYGDGIMLEEENNIDTIYHPKNPDQCSEVKRYTAEPLLYKVMEKGEIVIPLQSPIEIRPFVQQRLQQLPVEFKRFEYPHVYKVGISKKVGDLRSEMIHKIKSYEGFTDRGCSE